MKSSMLTMLSFLLRSCFLLLATSVASSVGSLIEDPDLDTSRGVDFLHSEFVPGTTYRSSSIVETTTHVLDLGGSDEDSAGIPNMDQHMTMDLDNTMDVSELPEGGKEIDIAYTRIAFSMTVAGQTLTFDSTDDTQDPNNPMAPILGAMMASKVTLIVDDEDHIVESNNPIVEKVAAAGLQDQSKQFSQMTRITKALPAEPVKPGDSWDYTMDGDGLPVAFVGKGTLVGYLEYEGYDCAVVVLEGELDMDMEGLGDLMDNPTVTEAMANIKTSGGKMTATIYFDPVGELARWTETTTTMTMELPSPFDPEKTMSMEVESVAKVSVDME